MRTLDGIALLLVFSGLWNIVDGAWSLVHPRLGHWWLSDLVRAVRLKIGVGLLLSAGWLYGQGMRFQ